LSDGERVLFRRLAVFAGGWTFDAANQVCTAERPRSGAKGSDDLYASDILDLLRQLVDKSLVTTAAPEGEARYRMLETIREYAFDKLRDAGEVESVRNGHCIYFRALAESANQQPKSERVVRQNRLEHEHDNLRAALRWILEQNEREQALTFCNVLSAFWSSRGYWTEARTWYEQTIAASRQPQPAASISYAHRVQYGIALDKCGTLAYWQGDYATAREQLDEALAIKRELGDNAGAASVLYSLGGLAWYQDDAQPAQAAWEEALALHHELGDKSSIASLLWSLGLLAKERGDFDESRRLTQESLTLQRELNNRGDAGWALENLAWLAMIEGDYAESKRLAEESLAIRQELNDQFPLAWSFIQKGYLAWHQSDCRAARAALRQGLVIFQGLRTSSFNTCLCLTGFAIVDMTEGYLTRGVKLLGAIQGESERTGRYNKDIFLTVYNQAFEMAQTQLDADSFNAARKAGHAMTLEQAIEYALNVAG
jgi:tetratricopeptide (TPR) repeat protein